VRSGEPVALALHQFQFAGWSARVDGRPVATRAAGPLGLVAVAVPAGEHEVAFAFGETPPRLAGAALTLAGLAAAAAWMVGWGRRAVAVAMVAVAGLAGVAAGEVRAEGPPRAVEARVGDVAALVGYRLEGGPARAGATLRVTLYWLALRRPERDYQVFVHLAAATDESKILAQHDGTPVYGFTPTTRWYPGEVVEDVHALRLPDDSSGGRYRLLAGLYDVQTVAPLPVQRGEVPDGGRVVLEEIELR
jgi:hypothetical protein